MVQTPWGEADELGSRRLRPGPGRSREKVDRNQRERLFAAMVAVSGVKGYTDTTVADLLEISQVSRSSFYRHFADKRACFLATMDEILSASLAVTASRLRSDGSWEERAEHAMMAFFEPMVAQPAAARLCLVESYAAGPQAVARLDEVAAGFQALAERTFEERSEYRGMPEEMTQAMVGGLIQVIHSRLRRETEHELLELGTGLLELGRSYRPPPRPLRRAGRRRGATIAGSSDGGGGATARGPREGDPGERIVRATLTMVAAKGYTATKVADITESAHISLSTFYDHFDDKAEAFAAAQYTGWTRMLGHCLPVYRRARSWPGGVRAVIEVSLSHLAQEPDFAQLICVDVYAAGKDALERRDRGMEAAQRLFDAGVEAHVPQMPAIAREGIVSALYAILCNRIRREGAGALPELVPLVTYMALVPFIGAEEACEVANGGRADTVRT